VGDNIIIKTQIITVVKVSTCTKYVKQRQQQLCTCKTSVSPHPTHTHITVQLSLIPLMLFKNTYTRTRPIRLDCITPVAKISTFSTNSFPFHVESIFFKSNSFFYLFFLTCTIKQRDGKSGDGPRNIVLQVVLMADGQKSIPS
jgi:hypothetical protein